MSSAGDAMAPKDGMSYATSEPMPATYCALGAAATHRQKCPGPWTRPILDLAFVYSEYAVGALGKHSI